MQQMIAHQRSVLKIALLMLTVRSLTFKKHENRQSRDPPVVNGKRQKVTFTENATVLFCPICWYTVCLRCCFRKL